MLLLSLLYISAHILNVDSKAAKLPFCYANCTLHDHSRKKYLESAFPEDFISGSDSLFSLLSKDHSKYIGKREFICGRLYFFGFTKVSYKDAVIACAQRRMQLMSINDGPKQQKCLADAHKFTNTIYGWLNADNSDYVWTSGMAEGRSTRCKSVAYSWCAKASSIVDPEFFNLSKVQSDQKCLAVSPKMGNLARQVNDRSFPFYPVQMQCSSVLVNFACEIMNTNVIDIIGNESLLKMIDDGGKNCKQPICEPITCYIDLKRIDFIGQHDTLKLIRPQLLGRWVKSCSVYYLIPKITATWKGAIDYCCSLGMRLLTIYSYEKQYCLGKVFERKSTLSSKDIF
ncbi:uncharacterized protein LOC132192823 [Neocloeon triangulifer]|uniref:uncharacterized protein LOC132192823 n=1 Tax=Neocloeon triangulifer TaxID=2078957 RepID=UPI00286F5DE9|nr:uncharacterized protein LOC132192823 [Neocloeon triangulifer]